MGLKSIFGYDYNGTNIEWYWKDQEKQHWKTWKPKQTDVKLLKPLTDKKENVKLLKEIFEEVIKNDFPKKEKLKGIYKVRS
tara:strand:- start:743 stop:985 length:243 start_codon:yes stop_codon:yes gene_type:complete